jgi:membrane protein DedA with SNARE-associated domain
MGGPVPAYFIPEARHLTTIVAGTSRLHYLTFTVLTYTGSDLVTILYYYRIFLGQGWHDLSVFYRRWILITSLAGVGIDLRLYVIYRCQRKNEFINYILAWRIGFKRKDTPSL